MYYQEPFTLFRAGEVVEWAPVHVPQRAREMGISLDQVREAVRNPSFTYPVKERGRPKHFFVSPCGEFSAVVVFGQGLKFVKTLEWTAKGEKKAAWRKKQADLREAQDRAKKGLA